MEIDLLEEDRKSIVYLKGPINENAGKVLTDLYSRVEKTIIFNFAAVDYVNSLGIRNWINFLRHIQEGRSIFFEYCTPDIVMQMNMMAHFKGSAKVLSFYGEYTCEHCGHEELILFKTGKIESLYEKIQNQHCPKCGSHFNLEEDEENYLQFLE